MRERENSIDNEGEDREREREREGKRDLSADVIKKVQCLDGAASIENCLQI